MNRESEHEWSMKDVFPEIRKDVLFTQIEFYIAFIDSNGFILYNQFLS